MQHLHEPLQPKGQTLLSLSGGSRHLQGVPVIAVEPEGVSDLFGRVGEGIGEGGAWVGGGCGMG